MSDKDKIRYLGDPKASPEEVAKLTDPAHLIQLTADQLIELAEKAQQVHDRFKKAIGPRMTAKRARKIRAFRNHLGFRVIAYHAYAMGWGEEPAWWPPSNSLAGMVLCEEAARVLGEDPNQEPWLLGPPPELQKIIDEVGKKP